MSTLDIILLVCFIPAILRGLKKGFVEQGVALLSIFLGTYLAYHFSQLVSAWLQPVFVMLTEKQANVIAFGVILIVVILALYIIGKLILKILKITMLGWVDKVLGFAFSIFKAALLIGLVIILLEGIDADHFLISKETLENSVLYCAIRDMSHVVFPYLRAIFNA